MQVKVNDIEIKKQDELYYINTYGKTWEMYEEPKIIFQNGRYVHFKEAKRITSQVYETGVGKGIMTHYDDFKGVNFCFDTYVWVEYATSKVYFEWIPINEKGFAIKEILWPSAFSFKEKDGFSVIPYMQGVLLPFDYEADWEDIVFDGQLCSAALYMPWLGQYTSHYGYMMINETPHDAAYEVHHKANQKSEVVMKWLPSLEKMSYKRVLQYQFFKRCDYNTMCKCYKEYVKEQGNFVTLKEKAIRLPQIEKLKQSMFVHTGIKTNIQKDSQFYDREHHENNHMLTTFKKRCEEVQKYHDAGIEHVYMHIDGWAEFGYDNHHPDILPVCEEAGGYEGLKVLKDTMKECGYLLGIHDQYRDYYHNAKSYDIKNALQNADGSYYEHHRWAGGKQNYLCAALAKSYVKRNFEILHQNHIEVDAAYLDVFTCNELDECINPHHRMTRKECAKYRNDCFAYLTNKGIIPSSEECVDWAMPFLVFSHYGPYEFMMHKEGTSRKGIGVPLFNLVYHECILLPWPMEKGKEDYMLYALVNGGLPYLKRDGAYPNVDGVFKQEETFETQKERALKTVDFANMVAGEELVSHTFMNDYRIQKSVFANGKEVIVDFMHNTYEIK